MCGFSVTMTAVVAADVACARAKNPAGTPRPVYAHAPPMDAYTRPTAHLTYNIFIRVIRYGHGARVKGNKFS